MAITAPGSISENRATEVRTNVSAADSTTINDGNFAPANATSCEGWKRVLVFVRFNAGTAPTATIMPLARCGAGWVKLPNTAALAEGVGAIVETNGRHIFFRVEAITGSPTDLDVWVAGYEPFKADSASRS